MIGSGGGGRKERRAARGAALLLLTASCITSSGGEGGGGGGSTATPTTGSATLGLSGGHVTTSDGAIDVFLPYGAVTANVAIKVKKIDAPAAGSVGSVFDISPSGTTFARPVVLTFRYGAADLAGADPETLSIATYQNGQWQLYPSRTDMGAGTIAASVNHFSPWAVVLPGSGTIIDAGVPTSDASVVDATPPRDAASAGGGGNGGASGAGGNAGAGGGGGKGGNGGASGAGGGGGKGGAGGASGASGSGGASGAGGKAGAGGAGGMDGGAGGASGHGGASGAGGASGSTGASGSGGAAGHDAGAPDGPSDDLASHELSRSVHLTVG